MTVIRFSQVVPHPQLSPYIDKMLVFESSGRLPDKDKQLIVPNANLKLTIASRNGLIARIADQIFIQPENKITLSGLIDSPVNLNPAEDVHTDTIVVEFNPMGAYRLFNLSYAEFKNQIIDLSDHIGSRANEIEIQLAEAQSLEQKIHLLQNFLIKQLERTTADQIFDYCVDRITVSKGLITVAQLEKETGYTSRWLHRKFLEHLGTGAKNLSEIIRFKQFYKAYATGASLPDLKGHIYTYYHDQSHFIRAFKRFTGHTPTNLQNSINELATKHYSS